MIYYLIIPYSPVCDNSVLRELHGKAIVNHCSLGNNPPNIANELQCSIIVTSIAALKRLNLSKEDEIRLCLQQDSRYSIPCRNHFDMSSLPLTTEIYNYLKQHEFNINSKVVYV